LAAREPCFGCDRALLPAQEPHERALLLGKETYTAKSNTLKRTLLLGKRARWHAVAARYLGNVAARYLGNDASRYLGCTLPRVHC